MSRALALALAMVVLALLLATPHGGTQAQDQVEAKVRWTKYINPTEGLDGASGTCVFGDYIAVVGSASDRPYVALLRKSDVAIVGEWIGSEREGFVNCISIGGKLYAIGAIFIAAYGVIYVFDENLNILARIMRESPSEYYSLVYNDGVLYLGGAAIEDVDEDGIEERVWLVERRALDASLSPVSSKKIYSGSWDEGYITDIGVEPSTGRIWAVGWYRDSDYIPHSLIVILDSDLREFKVIDYPYYGGRYLGLLRGIAFDGEHVYISGDIGVAKFTADGRPVAINRDGKAREKIVYGYDYLYTFGEEKIRDYVRHMLYIHDTDLNLVKSYVLSENVNADSHFYPGRPVLEGNNIYVAGVDKAIGDKNTRMVVYSLSIEGVMVTTATGVEGVVTIIATTTPAYSATPVSDGLGALLMLILIGGMLALLFLLLASSSRHS